MPVGPFTTVVGASVPLTVELSGPPPTTGARFTISSNPPGLCLVDHSADPNDPNGQTLGGPPAPNAPPPLPDDTFEVLHADYLASKRQDGTAPHVVRLKFPKKTTPTAPLTPPQPVGALPWNTVKIAPAKTQDGAPWGATVAALEAQFQVTVSGVALAFPHDDWWIKPAGWSATPEGNTDPARDWTPVMVDALRNEQPFAWGDQVEVRVLRHGAWPHLPPQTPPLGGTTTPPPPLAPADELPAGKLAKLSSWAFGCAPIATGGPALTDQQRMDLVASTTTHRPVSHEVTWLEGERLSQPVLVTLEPPVNVLDLIRQRAQQTPQERLLGRAQPVTTGAAKFPRIPVTIAPIAKGLAGTPTQLRGGTTTTTTTTTGVVHEWGAAAPGHEKGLRVARRREVGFEASFALEKHQRGVLETLALPIVSSALALDPIDGTVHGLCLEENGTYEVPWTIPRGATTTRCEVVLRHPTKLTPDVQGDVEDPPRGPPPPPPDPTDTLERLVIDVPPGSAATVVDPDEVYTPYVGPPPTGGRRKKVKAPKLLKALSSPEVVVEIALPFARFDEPPLADPPPGSKRSAWILEKLSQKKRVRAVFGVGDKARFVLVLDRPAPKGGAKARLLSTAFGPKVEDQTLDVEWPEGGQRLEKEVTLLGPSPKPQRVQLVGLPRTGRCDGAKTTWLFVADEPAVYLPARDDDWSDEEGLDYLFGEKAYTDWLDPPGPYAWKDEVTVKVRLSQPAKAGGARADLVCDAFDRRYAVDFAEGAQDVEVKVVFGKRPKTSLVLLAVEGVTGCVSGWRGKKALQVLAERAAYFPPRACLAPSGPFVKGDHCTLSLMLHPHAPRGGAKVTLRGPFQDTPVEFAEGELFQAVTVELDREADQPQQIALVPDRACERGSFAEFDVVVKTPAVGFAPGVLFPERVARTGEETTVVLTLSHPAPGKRPATPDELKALRAQARALEDGEEVDAETKRVTDPQDEHFGATITLECDAFETQAKDGRVRALFVPGTTQTSVAVKLKADEAFAGERTVTLLADPAPYRCAIGPAATAKITVSRSPWVAFADPPFRPGPGVPVTGTEEQVVFKAGESAVLRLQAERAPLGKDLRVAVKSPAFGGKVYFATIPGLGTKSEKSKEPDKGTVHELPPAPIELTVVLARGHLDAGGGKPERPVTITLAPPRGWRPASGDEGSGTLELQVLAPTPSESCPLKRVVDEATGEETLEDDPTARPCNLTKVLIAEFHGELDTAPDPTAPIDPLNPPPIPPKPGTTETELSLVKGTTNLVDAKRGPWELVRELAQASDPDLALVHAPGQPPVLKVIAGKVPNPLRASTNKVDPKFHRTHLSIQLPRGSFCADLFEEQRKAPVLTTGQPPQRLLGGVRPTTTLETLVRHHPLVDVSRRAAETVGPGKKKKKLAFVHPAIGDVRARVAPSNDPVFPPLEPPQGGDGPKVVRLKPGEDATTVKGYATAATFTVEPRRMPLDRLTLLQLPQLAPSPLNGALGPTVSALHSLGLDPLGDVVQGVSDTGDLVVGGTNDVIGGVNTVLPFLSKSTGTNTLDTSKVFDPATGTILGLQPMQVLQLLWFFKEKPRTYHLSVQSCGRPDPAQEVPAPPCEELACTIEVYPSEEMNFTWKFKPIPETVKVGVDGKYIADEGRKEQDVYGTGQDKSYEDHQEERQERVEQSEAKHEELQEKKLDEQAREGTSDQLITEYSQTDQERLDHTAKDTYQAQALDRDVEYRTEITLPPRTSLEGRWGQPGKLEKTGQDQGDSPQETDVGDMLSWKYRKVLGQGEPRRAKEDGWHGGAPSGSAPGWTPRKEPGQSHQVKSKVFHPVGYGSTMLGPIPADELPPSERDSLQVCQDVVTTRVDDHLGSQERNAQSAQEDLQDDVTCGQNGLTQTQTEAQTRNPFSTAATGADALVLLANNGGTDAALAKVADAIKAIGDTLLGLLDIFKKIGGDWVPTFGWGLRFEVGFLEGALTFYWGWKEALNGDFALVQEKPLTKEVFRWYALHVDLVLISLRFILDVGFRAVAAFLHFELVIYLKIALDASIKGGFERTRPDKVAPDWIDTWLISSAKAELGAKLVLVNEHLIAAHACLRTGFDFKWRFALPDLDDLKSKQHLPERKRPQASRFGIEYEIHFVGVSAHFTFTILGFGTRPLVKQIIDGNPPELPIRRGMFPGAASRSFNNLRQMLKLGWNKAVYQRRRIVNRHDAWQELQLAMVGATRQRNQDGTPKWPKTKIKPGYAYAGGDDDEEKKTWWAENKDAWDAQWAECRDALGRETFKVRKKPGKLVKVSLQKVNLGERLTALVGKVEDIFTRKLLPMLGELDERVALLKQLDDQATQEEADADEGGQPSKELLRAVRKLEREDKVLNWRQTIADKPLDTLDRAFLSLAYYHPQREVW